ncbi:MAG TPA: 2-C-methyl-D-erythritol 2,4-cyclodiphosphate synthase [Phycisphaerae bacterium]|nr:2-C-methyl-D-erythritol 2,4-cyclodiphosphate synthase [Phycisphaerae bacterium]
MSEPIVQRVGIGTDLHRLVAGRKLILGGVTIPFEKGLEGHSDADVVLHSLTDAILGAAGLPDIGELFPDTDAKLANADSRVFLEWALAEARRLGWAVANVDLIIHAERPKLTAHKTAIRDKLAAMLSIDAARISVKAKTNEGMDAIGRGEAIGCTCVVGLFAHPD